jgi:hypothetical protein
MSNQTFENAKADIGNFRDALKIVPTVASTPENHSLCRNFIVEKYPAVKPGTPIIHKDFYTLALTALFEAGKLEIIQAPAPGYKMGRLWDDDDDTPRAPAPLPASPADPFTIQARRDEEKVIEAIHQEFLGRTLTPEQSLHEAKLRQAAQRPDPELKDANVIVYATMSDGSQRVNRAATERARDAATQHNDAVLAARKAAQTQGAL